MPPKAAVTTGFFAKNASRITSGAFSYQKVREAPSRLRKPPELLLKLRPVHHARSSDTEDGRD
jgi:hypothetical protein